MAHESNEEYARRLKEYARRRTRMVVLQGVAYGLAIGILCAVIAVVYAIRVKHVG